MDVPWFAFNHDKRSTDMYTKKATEAVIPVAVSLSSTKPLHHNCLPNGTCRPPARQRARPPS
jgi:hypothetical protein